MNNYQLQILREVEKYVSAIFEHKVNPIFVYHNLDHTQQVVVAAQEIATHYPLEQNEQFALLIGAWFHDTGFILGHSEGHEKESINLATNFLKHITHRKIVEQVSSCILATHIPQTPINLPGEIICDADLFHLGTNRYREMNARLKQEYEYCLQRALSNEEWRQCNIDFLTSHKYFTAYCHQKLELSKQEWIEQLQYKYGARVERGFL